MRGSLRHFYQYHKMTPKKFRVMDLYPYYFEDMLNCFRQKAQNAEEKASNPGSSMRNC